MIILCLSWTPIMDMLGSAAAATSLVHAGIGGSSGLSDLSLEGLVSTQLDPHQHHLHHHHHRYDPHHHHQHHPNQPLPPHRPFTPPGSITSLQSVHQDNNNSGNQVDSSYSPNSTTNHLPTSTVKIKPGRIKTTLYLKYKHQEP